MLKTKIPIKDLNVRLDTIKLLEENIGRTVFDINHSKIFFNPSPRIMEIKVKINKWDRLKLKAFVQQEKMKVAQSCLTLSHGLYSPWNSPGQNTEVGTSFPSFQPRDWTQVSHIGGGFFTSWAIRETKQKDNPQIGRKNLQMVWLIRHSVQFSSDTQSSDSATPWTTAHQAFLSITNSWSPPKPMSVESVMPSNHLTLCRPLLLCPQSFPASVSFQIWNLQTAYDT